MALEVTPTILPASWTPLKPHPVQSLYWRAPQRFVNVAAGRGSGKTELALRRLALRSRLPDSKHFYAGPTVNQAKRIAWERLQELIPKAWILSVHTSELIIRTKYNSYIQVVGMDKPHRIEGTQWNGGVFDEASDQKPGAFGKSIYPALTHKRGWCWRIGVPKRTGIGAREFKEQFDEGKHNVERIVEGRISMEQVNMVSFSWPSSTVLPPDIIEEARKNLSEKDFNEQFCASWENAAGAIYYAFDQKVNVEECKYNKDLPIIVGSDFNVTPMSWVLCHCIEPKDRKAPAIVRVFDEIRLNDTNTPATLNHLYRKYGKHEGGWYFYGDAASKQRKTNASLTDYQLILQDSRFQRKRVFYPKKNPPLKDRFAATNAMLRNAAGQSRLFVDSKCRALIDDMKHRAYKEGSCEPDDPPSTGHMADALDYYIYADFPVGNEFISKSAPKAGSY